MKNSISAHERKKSQLIRISDIVFDFSQHIYPHWYPIVKDTRLCCHYHLHEHIEIIVVDEGYVTFQVNGHQYDLSRNDILFINPFEPHSASIPSGCNRTVYHAVNLDLNLLKTIPRTAFNHILDDLTNSKSAYNNILSSITKLLPRLKLTKHLKTV